MAYIFETNVKHLTDVVHIRGFKSAVDHRIKVGINFLGSPWFYDPPSGRLVRFAVTEHRRMKIEEALISTGIPFTMRVTPEWIKEG